MSKHPTFGAVLAALTSVLATLLISSPAEADLVLVVGNPAQNGIVAAGESGVNFTPATVNPAHALSGGSRASLSQNGAQLILSLTVNGGGYSSTGVGPDSPLFGSIPIQILGTSGETPGTPVTIRLESSYGGMAPRGGVPQLFVNGIKYQENQTHTIEGLTVGDTFRYWAVLSGSGSDISAMLIPILTVQSAGGQPGPPHASKRISITSPDEGSSQETAPVTLEVTLSRGAQASDFSAFLNGRDITSTFAPVSEDACNVGAHDPRPAHPPKDCDLAATVVPNDGLLRGENRLRVVVRNPNGSPAEATRSFFVKGPKADAGPDRSVPIGQAVSLDGSTSSSTRPLRHHWLLTDKPEGSRAEIVDPFAVSTTFTPDVRGTYLVQLVVNDGHFDSEPAILTVRVGLGAPLIPVLTRVVEGIGRDASDYLVAIGAGSRIYPATTGASLDGVHVLVINRQSLAVESDKTYDTSGAAGTLIADLNAIEGGKLVIVSTLKRVGAGFCPTQSKNRPCPVGAALATLGATDEFGQIHDQNFVFNLIGIKGIKQGGAWQNGSSELSGYFTQDVKSNYTFTQTDYVKFELHPYTGSEPVGNVGNIVVGGTSYDGGGRLGSAGGFHLVVLDRAAPTRAARFEQVYHSDNGYMDLDEKETLATRLNSIPDESNLVLITSFGQQDNAALRQTGLPKAIGRFGANPYVVAQLDGPATYSLVSALSSEDKFAGRFPAVEASSVLAPDDPDGQARGLLGRGRRGSWFEPVSFDFNLSTDISYDLQSIAWQLPTAWPSLNGSGQQNAFLYINRQVVCGNPDDTSPGCSDPRTSKYADFTAPTDPARWASTAANLLCPSDADRYGFSCAGDDFEPVKEELAKEYLYVQQIFDLRNAIQNQIAATQADFTLTTDSVASEVKAAVRPPSDNGVGMQILQTILTIVGAGAGLKDQPEFSAAVTIFQSFLSLVQTLANADSGDPVGTIEARVDQLEEVASQAFPVIVGATDMLFRNILADYGRLEAVAKHKLDADKGWSWDEGTMLEASRLALRRYYFKQLLPLVYSVDQVGRNDDASVQDIICGGDEPYTLITSEAAWTSFPTILFPGDRKAKATDKDVFIINKTVVDSAYRDQPPDDLLNELFEPTTESINRRDGKVVTGLAVPKLEFFIKWPFAYRTFAGCHIAY